MSSFDNCPISNGRGVRINRYMHYRYNSNKLNFKEYSLLLLKLIRSIFTFKIKLYIQFGKKGSVAPASLQLKQLI